MATGTIVNVWRRDGRIHAAVRVAEAGAQGNVEYTASVPDDDDWNAMSGPEKKAVLVAAVKAVRDTQQAGTQAVAGISGSVTL